MAASAEDQDHSTAPASPRKRSRISLAEAIARFCPAEKWGFLIDAAGGKEADVLEFLSGRYTGKFLLLHELAKNGRAEREAQLFSELTKVRGDLIAAFDAKRHAGLVLKGLPSAYPAKPVPIPAARALEYDFTNNIAKIGELVFQDVMLAQSAVPAKPKAKVKEPKLPQAELRQFCQEYIRDYKADNQAAPSIDTLHDAARARFPDHPVRRDAIRSLHAALLTSEERRQGPRGKQKRIRQSANPPK